MAKYWLSYIATVFLLSIFATVVFWYVTPPEDRVETITSPIPDFLTRRENSQVRLLDFWQPIIETIHGSEVSVPQTTARSILMYDLASDKTLFEKQASLRVPMASLTKIMTAIVTLENPKSPDSYLVRAEDLVGEDSMGLKAGEILTRDELLYGLMLPSGNDASEVLAQNFPGGRGEFLAAMHDKALALGLKDTAFSNPSGLQGDGIQYTTARDLLVMTKYALDTFPLFREIVATYEKQLPATPTHQAYTLYNETNLLTTYPGVKGVKTGYTPEAGMCLVSYLEYGEHKIVGIVLNSENRREEMKQLLDYSLRSLGTEPPAHQ
jgi:serine-type D-Ala-D-Ala carboxypeptidase (penicillin-binding protein 5/6)